MRNTFQQTSEHEPSASVLACPLPLEAYASLHAEGKIPQLHKMLGTVISSATVPPEWYSEPSSIGQIILGTSNLVNPAEQRYSSSVDPPQAIVNGENAVCYITPEEYVHISAENRRLLMLLRNQEIADYAWKAFKTKLLETKCLAGSVAAVKSKLLTLPQALQDQVYAQNKIDFDKVESVASSRLRRESSITEFASYWINFLGGGVSLDTVQSINAIIIAGLNADIIHNQTQLALSITERLLNSNTVSSQLAFEIGLKLGALSRPSMIHSKSVDKTEANISRETTIIVKNVLKILNKSKQVPEHIDEELVEKLFNATWRSTFFQNDHARNEVPIDACSVGMTGVPLESTHTMNEFSIAVEMALSNNTVISQPAIAEIRSLVHQDPTAFRSYVFYRLGYYHSLLESGQLNSEKKSEIIERLLREGMLFRKCNIRAAEVLEIDQAEIPITDTAISALFDIAFAYRYPTLMSHLKQKLEEYEGSDTAHRYCFPIVCANVDTLLDGFLEELEINNEFTSDQDGRIYHGKQNRHSLERFYWAETMRYRGQAFNLLRFSSVKSLSKLARHIARSFGTRAGSSPSYDLTNGIQNIQSLALEDLDKFSQNHHTLSTDLAALDNIEKSLQSPESSSVKPLDIDNRIQQVITNRHDDYRVRLFLTPDQYTELAKAINNSRNGESPFTLDEGYIRIMAHSDKPPQTFVLPKINIANAPDQAFVTLGALTQDLALRRSNAHIYGAIHLHLSTEVRAPSGHSRRLRLEVQLAPIDSMNANFEQESFYSGEL